VADGVFNIAKGRVRGYTDQVGVGNAALVVVLLKSAGIEADDALNNHDTLAAILAAANDEADFTNYARKVVTSVTPTVDDTANDLDLVIGNQEWTSAGGASNNTLAKILVCFDPDTTGGTDSAIVPLTYHDFAVTTDGSNLTAEEPANGFFGAS